MQGVQKTSEQAKSKPDAEVELATAEVSLLLAVEVKACDVLDESLDVAREVVAGTCDVVGAAREVEAVTGDAVAVALAWSV